MAKIRRSRKRKKNYQPEGNPGIKSYIVGLCASLLVTLILFLLWSVVLSVSSISESSIDIFVLFTLVVSVFCGGFVCTMGTRKNGWISGGIIGILYVLVLLVFGSGIAETDMSLSSLANLLIAFIVGGIGGTVSLNI